MSSAGTALGADDAARACAWADRLTGLGRVDQARKVLRATLDDHGGYVPAVLALAKLEISAGSAASAADLLRQFLRDYPADRECGCLLAETLLGHGRPEEAAAVIRDFSTADTASRELAGRICRAQGRHRDAVRAFGPRASLSRQGRRLRRRSWWRSGGPVSFRARLTPVAALRAAAVPPAPEPPDALLEKAGWAQWLDGQGRREEARSFLIQALADDGRHPLLLRCLAQIENEDGARATGLFLWREADAASPGDMDIIVPLSFLLASTTATDALIKRSSDALRVLETYSDQSDPRIRAARARALRAADAAPSVVAAAYGGRSGLQAGDLRQRRLLRLRSAGPVGQLRVRLSGRLPGQSDLPALLRTEAESEDIARALDSLAGTDPPAARERLEEAMRKHGRTPSLLLAYAGVEGPDNADWHWLALAAEAVRRAPGSVDTACALAWAARWILGYEGAVQVLTGLPAGQREATECRVLLGNLHRAAGNRASAFAAYPPALALDRYDRRARRSCAWTAIVPGRWRRRRRESYDPVDLAGFDPLPAGIARIMDEADRCHDDVTAARALLAAAVDDHARHPLLLLGLARLERQRGDRHAGGALAAEAVSAAPGDALTTAVGIFELSAAGYVSTALQAAQSARQAFSANAPIRFVTGDLYWSWGFPAKAVEAYGDFDHQPYRRYRRRSSWWRSGSVFNRIRQTAVRQENGLQPDPRRPAPEPPGLSALDLEPVVATAVREDLAACQVNMTVRGDNRPELARAWLDWRYFLPTWTLLMLAAFTFAEQRRWPAAGTTGDLAAAAAAAAVAACLYWLGDNFARNRLTVWLLILAGCAGAAVALMSAGRWQFTAGLALGGSACGGLTVNAASVVITAVYRLLLARWQRRNAETVVLGGLLELIAALSAPLARRDAGTRQASVHSLERLAVRVQRHFPDAVHGRDARSQRTLANRAEATAAALRDMKIAVALPDESSRQNVLRQLKGLAAALARGSFEDWPPPRPAPAEQKVKRPLWWHALQHGRTALLILVPPLAAWFVPLVDGVAWLRTASVTWAILVLLVALDPTIGKRLTPMREVLSLFKDTAPPRDAGFGGAREQGDNDDKRELA